MQRQWEVTLREFLERVLDERDRLYEARMKAMQTESDKAANALGIRLEGMNEIRAQLGTQRAEFATNEKLEALAVTTRAQFDALATQIASSASLLRETTARDLDALRERADRDQKTIVDDIRGLRESRSETGGKSAGAKELSTTFIAVAGIVLFMVSILISSTLAIVLHFLK